MTNSTARRTYAITALALVAALAIGFGAGRVSARDEPPTSEAPGAIMVDGKYSDRRFIDMMVPHHQMALDMAEDALKESENQDIRTLSERILRGQANEIEELKRLRQESYGSRRTPKTMHPDAMAGMGMGDHGSSGAHSGGGHHAITASTSDEFDRRFLDDMLAHHAAAIQHASLALVHSNNERLKVIARDIVDEQAREIGMMGQWRLLRWEHLP